MANLIPKIVKMLGVELGEEFKVVYKTRFEIICNFTMAGLFVHKGDSGRYEKELLADIICGKAEIVKLPWKPKKGDVYFTFELLDGKWVVRSFWWGGFPNEYGLLEKGWVYRTCAEAQAALPAVAAEMGVEYELPTSDTEAVEPWKPKEGEFYYSFGIFAQTWGVSKICWLQHPFDFALLAKGWVYRTKEEAKAALPEAAKEMGVDYEL